MGLPLICHIWHWIPGERSCEQSNFGYTNFDRFESAEAEHVTIWFLKLLRTFKLSCYVLCLAALGIITIIYENSIS